MYHEKDMKRKQVDCDMQLGSNEAGREENSDAGPVRTAHGDKQKMRQDIAPSAQRRTSIGLRAVMGHQQLQDQAEIKLDHGTYNGDFFDIEMDTGQAKSELV
jgi:hypothetical protein